jgi:hypothetical protein
MNLKIQSAGNLALPTFIQNLNNRERLLIATLGLIGLILLPMKVYDWQQTAAATVAEEQSNLASARQMARSSTGLGFPALLAEKRSIIRSWTWIGPSPAVGRVLIESQISEMALKAGMTRVEVKSADSIRSVSGVDFVRLDITAPFDWMTLYKFITALVNSRKGFVIDSIAASDETPSRLHLILSVPLMIPKRNSH